jgi:hypothetical protein
VSHRDNREPVGWTVSHAWAKQKGEIEGADNDFVPGLKRERWRGGGGGYNARRSEGGPMASTDGAGWHASDAVGDRVKEVADERAPLPFKSIRIISKDFKSNSKSFKLDSIQTGPS